jgi:hypothetical protein
VLLCLRLVLYWCSLSIMLLLLLHLVLYRCSLSNMLLQCCCGCLN